ncbi:MAG: NAD(P)-dependent oxidoreductase [Sedimentisphaerales bacterium]|nr:NAD(P)-dependent oxidoreductase [Sedimentisphaerales bacterium]
MANVLVVGGAGWVGGEVVRQSLARGDVVSVLDRVAPQEKAAVVIIGDFTDTAALQKALEGRRFDVVYHVASLPGDTGNPYEMMSVNVLGLLNMLEWAKINPVKRYVVSSSISAMQWYPATKFCPPKYMPVDEEHPDDPKDMYSTTKRMQELLAMTYYHQYKVPTTVLRLTAVVGPSGKGGGRGYREMARMLKEGGTVQIPHFSAEELCHYVDIRDVARMHLVVGEHAGAVGEIFNCCAKEPTRGSDFAKACQQVAPGIKVEFGFAWSMAQGGQISFSMEKAKRLLGYEPKYTLADAVRSIRQWVDAGGLEESATKTEQRYGTGVKAE